MLVVFPIAFLVATLICDLIFLGTGDEDWATAAIWMLGVGVGTAAVAAMIGFVDFFGDRRIRALKDAWMHMLGNATALILSLLSFSVRWSAGPVDGVLPWGLLLSAIVVGLLLFTGWKGGELVYRHRVGMTGSPQQSEAPSGYASGRPKPAE